MFLWDSGSTVGEVYGHSKVINSVDIRQKRPYRMVTGSDDKCVCYSEGPPFKFKSTSFVSDNDFFFPLLFIFFFKYIAVFNDTFVFLYMQPISQMAPTKETTLCFI